MKKSVILSVMFVILSCMFASGQDQQTPPSFYEVSEYRHRYPETDTNIDLYIRSWRDSHQHVGHGGFLEREIFFGGDPLNPPRTGAVLRYLKECNHGVLNPGCTTKPTVHEKEQVLFYVTKGSAAVDAGGRKAEISEGSYVFIPAGLEYEFLNTSDQYLDVIIITEDISDDFKPLNGMIVGSYHNSVPRTGWQWAYEYNEIATGAKFDNPVTIAVVTMNSFDIAHPYIQKEGTEEIWYQLKGESFLLLGNRLRKQREGEAYLVPPNGKIPHASINPTQESMKWLYICNRHGK